MKLLKNTAILLVLAVFLLPASGVVFFMHYCSSMATVELSFDGSNSCCTVPAATFRNQQSVTGSSLHDGNCTHQISINKQSCCKDSRLYVKIESNYLASFFKVLQPEISLISWYTETSLSPNLHLNLLPGESTDSPDPPGQDILLVTSSLRL